MHEPHGAHEEREEHEHGLSHTFFEKLIEVRSMDRGQLTLTMLAMAAVVVAVLLLTVRDLPWPEVLVGFGQGGSTSQSLPLPILVGCGVFLVLAWSYILVGALHAHLALRAVALVCYTVALIPLPVVASNPVAALGTLLLVGTVWTMAIALWAVDRFHYHRSLPSRHHRARLKVSTFLFFLVVTATLYLLGALGGARSGNFGAFIALQLAAIQFVLIPMLYLAGTDFAEWSEVVAGRIGTVGAVVGPRVLGLLVAVASVLILVERVSFYHITFSNLKAVGFLMAPALISLLLMAGFGWVAVRRGASTRVPFWSLVVACLVGYCALLGGAFLTTLMPAPAKAEKPPDYVTYSHPEKPAFTLEYRNGWKVRSVEQQGGEPATFFEGIDPSGLPVRVVVLAVDGAQAGGTSLLSSRGAAVLGGPVQVVGETVRQGQWDVQDFTLHAEGTDYQGAAWTRGEGNQRWLVAGVAPLIAGGEYQPVFERMLESWQPRAQEAPAGGSGEQQHAASAGEQSGGEGSVNTFPYVYTLAPFLWLPVLLVAALLIWRGGMAATGGLFIASAGIFHLFYGLNYLFALFIGHPMPRYVFPATMQGVTGAIALLALLYVLFLLVTRRMGRAGPPLRLVLVLLLGLVGLRILYDVVFAQALSASRLSLAQALVLLLALMWDVAMSGEHLTNQHGRHVPRHSRVLMYFGYTILVATAVLFFSSLRGGAHSAFESDMWPQLGILLMGLPLLLTFFIVNVGAWLRRQERVRSDQVEHVRPEERRPDAGHTAGF